MYNHSDRPKVDSPENGDVVTVSGCTRCRGAAKYHKHIYHGSIYLHGRAHHFVDVNSILVDVYIVKNWGPNILDTPEDVDDNHYTSSDGAESEGVIDEIAKPSFRDILTDETYWGNGYPFSRDSTTV